MASKSMIFQEGSLITLGLRQNVTSMCQYVKLWELKATEWTD